MENKVSVEFIGMEPTEALKQQALAKVTKHQELIDLATSINLKLKQRVHSKGVLQDYEVEITMNIPQSRIHVEETGEDMYALLDKATDVLFRRARRYQDKKQNWDGTTPWRVLEAENQKEEMDRVTEGLEFKDYIPSIVVRRKMDSQSPMVEAEAIERMELEGFVQYFFKRTDGKFCMVYLVSEGKYGIIEQADSTI